MSEDRKKSYWVYVETRPDGSAYNAGLELLSECRRLADEASAELCAIIISGKTKEAIETASAYGPDVIITAEGDEYERYLSDAYVNAMSELASKYKPDVILIAATPNGRDMAPRLAIRLGTGLTADCTGLEYDKERDCIVWTRPALGGNLNAEILCEEKHPQMGTVRPGVFAKSKTDCRTPEIIREELHIPAEKIRTRILEIVGGSAGDNPDLESADIIVAGGKGLGGPEGFTLIRELADLLGGEVGASRAAVDAGWISRQHQVGQTGRTVTPKIYIACGISGAVQHIAGMNKSDMVIAINSDPEAPIFKAADYGICGNLHEVIPELIESIKAK